MLWLISAAAQFERMVTSVITYPRFIDRDEDPPIGLSPPYVAQTIAGSLPFVPFSHIPTMDEWRYYSNWVERQKQRKEKRRKGASLENFTLGRVEGDILTELCLFSLAPSE